MPAMTRPALMNDNRFSAVPPVAPATRIAPPAVAMPATEPTAEHLGQSMLARHQTPMQAEMTLKLLEDENQTDAWRAPFGLQNHLHTGSKAK